MTSEAPVNVPTFQLSNFKTFQRCNFPTMGCLTVCVLFSLAQEKQLQGGLFRSESSRVSDHPSDAILGAKRGREELEVPTGHDIWSDFQDLVMKQGGNRGADYSQNAARFDASMIR